MRKFLVALCSFAVFGLWLAPVSAQDHIFVRGPGPMGPPGMMMGDGPGMMFPFVLRKLDLTADQDAQVQKIMEAHKPKFQELFEQLRTAHEAIGGRLFAAGPLSATDLSPQTQQISQLREQLMNEGLIVALEIRSVLTPDQLTKAAQLQQQMKALHEQMHNLMEEK
jgi:Spy/CpxP family protein refolding chaperone